MSEACKMLGKYCIIKHYFYYRNEEPPCFEVVPEFYDSYEEAVLAATALCLEETKELEQGKVEDGLDFRGNEVDLQEYACCTTAWDGDDYYVVTGYIILQNLSKKENRHA